MTQATPTHGLGHFGLCFYADCWGFKAKVRANTEQAFADLRELHHYIELLLDRDKTFRHSAYILSDSLFLTTHFGNDPARNEEALNNTLNVVEQLANKAFHLSLPLRGTFGIGSLYEQDNCLVGSSILSAVSLTELLVPPLAVICRHTLQDAVDRKYLHPTVLSHRSGRAGVVGFHEFVECPSKKGGCFLVQPMAHAAASQNIAREWLAEARRSNLMTAEPFTPAVTAIDSALQLLLEWDKTYE